MTVDAKTIGEEILGAELVAGKELAEATGNLFEAMERGGEIVRQQAGWWLADYGDFWLRSLRVPPDPGALPDLIDRRSRHIATGFQDMSSLVQRECAPLTRMWGDFFSVIRQDWRRD